MNVFDIIKAKLPKEKRPEDTVLALKVAEVGQLITSYLNRSTVPNELEFVHANMVLDLIASDERQENPDNQRVVASIKEGDVQVNFGSAKGSTGESAAEGLLYNYMAQLNKFRRMRW